MSTSPPKSVSTCSACVGLTRRICWRSEQRLAGLRLQEARVRRGGLECGWRPCQPGGNEFADAMGGMLQHRQNEGERPGQKWRANASAFSSNSARPRAAWRSQDMRDQGIEMRAPFCFKNARDSFALCGVRAEPINRLGRERDKAARENDSTSTFLRICVHRSISLYTPFPSGCL